tara:strand:- start:675 stop:788 length:114 start_codon:yes stop_codon:yes gene_type:complete
MAPGKLPKTRFLSCAKGLWGTPDKRTEAAPNGATRRV